MVFPVLKVDGVEHDVECIDYLNGKPTLVTTTIGGKKIYFWDKYSSFNPDAIDLVESIEWKRRYDPINEAIENLIATYEDELTNLAKKIAKLYVEESAIHPSLADKYADLKQLIGATNEVKNALNLILQK